MMTEMKRQDKWYFKTYTLIISFLCVGPFMLPLVWFNPHYSLKAKIIISAIILLLTFLLGFVFVKSLMSLMAYYQEIFKSW